MLILNTYSLEETIRLKREEVHTCSRLPKKARPSLFHRIRNRLGLAGQPAQPPQPAAATRPLAPSNLVFLQLYRSRRSRRVTRRLSRNWSQPS